MPSWQTKDVVVVVAASIGAAASLCGPFLNHVLSRRKYASEKLWDIRKDMYSALLSELHEAHQQANFAKISFRHDSHDMADEHAKNAHEAIERARASLRSNYLLCSPRVRAIWDDIYNKVALIYIVMEPGDAEFADAVSALRQGYDDVLSAAEAELGIRSPDLERLMGIAKPTMSSLVKALLRQYGL